MKKDEIIRAAILQAAEKLFQKWGIAKTTMEDIAREAGKGKSTLYYYFKSKEEILEAVALAQIMRITDKAKEAIAKKKTAKEKLFIYAYSTFKEIRESITLYDIARGEIKAYKTLIQGLLQNYDAIEEKILKSILRFGIERKEFKSIRPAEVAASARAIMIIKRSLTINLFIDNNDKELIDLIIKLLSEGL
jgi:AcrR family transcriptional regulator